MNNNTTDFNIALTNFLKVCQEIINKHWEDCKFTHCQPDVVKPDGGRKYLKIVRCDDKGNSRSVHCFIEIATGNVFKAASYKAPELNHPRCNIYDADNGRSGMDVYGCRYLRG